jgi:hypothetical protein
MYSEYSGRTIDQAYDIEQAMLPATTSPVNPNVNINRGVRTFIYTGYRRSIAQRTIRHASHIGASKLSMNLVCKDFLERKLLCKSSWWSLKMLRGPMYRQSEKMPQDAMHLQINMCVRPNRCSVSYCTRQLALPCSTRSLRQR